MYNLEKKQCDKKKLLNTHSTVECVTMICVKYIKTNITHFKVDIQQKCFRAWILTVIINKKSNHQILLAWTYECNHIIIFLIVCQLYTGMALVQNYGQTT